MSEQNFKNHAKFVPAFHFFAAPVLLLILIGSLVNVSRSIGDHERIYNATLILALTLVLLVTTFLARIFALKAQDRAIRAEENLRHYVITGKLLDRRLTPTQIVALRFASDEEFVALAAKAAAEGMAPKDIKAAVKSWKADDYRV